MTHINERTRPHGKRNMRLGLGLLGIILVAAIGFALWFFLLRQTPEQKLQAAMDNTMAPLAGLLNDENEANKHFADTVNEGFSLDLTAAAPASEFGDIRIAANVRSAPLNKLSDGRISASMGPRELIALSAFDNGELAQFRLGSEETGLNYELAYGEPGFEDRLAASGWMDMLPAEIGSAQDLLDEYQGQIEEQTSAEAQARREELHKNLKEQLEVANQEFMDSIVAESSGNEDLLLDGQTVKGEVITWTVPQEAILNYIDAAYRSLKQAMEEADVASMFSGLSAMELPDESIGTQDYLQTLDENYAAFRSELEESSFSVSGRAVVANEKLYKMSATFKDDTSLETINVDFTARTAELPLDNFVQTFSTDGAEDAKDHSVTIDRKKTVSEGGSYTDVWTFGGDGESIVVETAVGASEANVHTYSFTLREEAGEDAIHIAGTFRDGRTDKNYIITVDTILLGEMNLSDELGLEITFKTAPQQITPLSTSAKDILTLTEEDLFELQQYFMPIFGFMPEMIA